MFHVRVSFPSNRRGKVLIRSGTLSRLAGRRRANKFVFCPDAPTGSRRREWFGWRRSKDPAADKAAVFAPKAILQELDKRVPQYLDDVDQGKLVYPACKRPRSDGHGEVTSIGDHTRLEAIRYVTMVRGGELARR